MTGLSPVRQQFLRGPGLPTKAVQGAIGGPIQPPSPQLPPEPGQSPHLDALKRKLGR